MENIKRLEILVDHIEKEIMEIRKNDRELKHILTDTGLCQSVINIQKIIEEETEKRIITI